MKKIVLYIFLSTFIAISFSGGAKEYQPFVRKKLQPDFFMPNGILEYKEVLPPICTPKKVVAKDQKIELMKVINDENDDNTILEGGVPNTTSIAHKSRTKGDVVQKNHVNYNYFELADIPEYQQKYDEYIQDLKTIAKTGKVPNNENIIRDLSKMSSNQRISLGRKISL